MDYEIELWTIEGNHFAECTCGWQAKNLYQPVLEAYAKGHKLDHRKKGESAEIV